MAEVGRLGRGRGQGRIGKIGVDWKWGAPTSWGPWACLIAGYKTSSKLPFIELHPPPLTCTRMSMVFSYGLVTWSSMEEPCLSTSKTILLNLGNKTTIEQRWSVTARPTMMQSHSLGMRRWRYCPLCLMADAGGIVVLGSTPVRPLGGEEGTGGG